MLAGERTPYTGMIFVLKILKSDVETLRLDSTDLVRIDSVTPADGYGEKAYLVKVSFNPAAIPSLWSYRQSIILANNRYVSLYLLNHYLRTRGIPEYVIVALYYSEVMS